MENNISVEMYYNSLLALTTYLQCPHPFTGRDSISFSRSEFSTPLLTILVLVQVLSFRVRYLVVPKRVISRQWLLNVGIIVREIELRDITTWTARAKVGF